MPKKIQYIDYQTDDNNSRKMIVIQGKKGGYAFYQSTGKNSGFPNTWFPFCGLTEEGKTLIKPNFSKLDTKNYFDTKLINELEKEHSFNHELFKRFGNNEAMVISSCLGGGIWKSESGLKAKMGAYKNFKIEPMTLKKNSEKIVTEDEPEEANKILKEWGATTIDEVFPTISLVEARHKKSQMPTMNKVRLFKPAKKSSKRKYAIEEQIKSHLQHEEYGYKCSKTVTESIFGDKTTYLLESDKQYPKIELVYEKNRIKTNTLTAKINEQAVFEKQDFKNTNVKSLKHRVSEVLKLATTKPIFASLKKIMLKNK